MTKHVAATDIVAQDHRQEPSALGLKIENEQTVFCMNGQHIVSDQHVCLHCGEAIREHSRQRPIRAQPARDAKQSRIHSLYLADGSIARNVQLDAENARIYGAYLSARTILVTETHLPRLARAIKTLHAMKTTVIGDCQGREYFLLTDPLAILQQEREAGCQMPAQVKR